MERRGGQRPTVIRPDDAGVGRRGPIDVGAAIVTEDDLRVRMIAKRWKAADQRLAPSPLRTGRTRKRHQSKESGCGMHDHLRRNCFEIRLKASFLHEARPEFRYG